MLHSLPEWAVMSASVVEMFSSPTTSRKSAQAASRFVGAVLWDGFGAWVSGVVELGESAGVRFWPIW